MRVEAMPWNEGKRPWTRAMMVFLARWARRLSWKETAEAFDVSWEAVYRSVQWIVEWGLAHRVLTGITAIGLDELHWRKGKKSENFLTLIYQVDEGCRRLLWVGLRRTERSLRQGLKTLGAEVVAGIRVVVSDMWRPYLAVVRKHMSHAVQILDRFHLTALLNKAVDQVRRGEGYALRGQARGQRLKKTRWLLLKPRARVRGKARERLDAVIHSKLRTARAWMPEGSLCPFLDLPSPPMGQGVPRCLDHPRPCAADWTPCAKSPRRCVPMRALILNWFEWKKAFSSAAVEGLNNKARVVTRRSYGFRIFPRTQSGSVSYAWQTTRTRTHPQILLRRQRCMTIFGMITLCFEISHGPTACFFNTPRVTSKSKCSLPHIIRRPSAEWSRNFSTKSAPRNPCCRIGPVAGFVSVWAKRREFRLRF